MSFHKGPMGFQIDFENGWTVSVQFGRGNYCSNRYGTGNPFIDIPDFLESKTAEIAAWPTDSRDTGTSTNGWFTFEDGQEVKGWQNVDSVMEFINMVANFLPVLTAEDVKVASKKWKPILKDWGIDY